MLEVAHSFFLILLLHFFLFLLNFILLLSHNHPIVLIIKLVTTLIEKLLELTSHLRVVRTFVESQISACTQVLGELSWVSFAQNFNGCCKLFLLYPLVLVSLVVGLEPLPWQHSSQEIHAYITNAFHIISTRYFIDKNYPVQYPNEY